MTTGTDRPTAMYTYVCQNLHLQYPGYQSAFFTCNIHVHMIMRMLYGKEQWNLQMRTEEDSLSDSHTIRCAAIIIIMQ